MLAIERAQVENAKQEVKFLLGLTEKAWEDGVQTEARWLQAVVNTEQAWVQSLEAKMHMEKLHVEGNDVGM